jgi:hypothetical protein
MKYAILIDAGFLKRKLGSQTHPLDIGGVRDFLSVLHRHEALAAMSLHRIYWYDAPPLQRQVSKPLLGGEINFGATSLARSSTALLEALTADVFATQPPLLSERTDNQLGQQ